MSSIWISLVFLLLGTGKSENNYFEGWIKYNHDLILKSTNIDSIELKKFLGTGSTLYFKERNYLHTYDGSLFIQDSYRKDENRAYFKKNKSDTSFWIDCGTPGDEIIEFSFTPRKEEILGMVCDELKIYYKEKIVCDYYNSDSLKINPDWFKNFIKDGQNQIDQKEKAICLKHKTEYAGFIVIETAISFSREKIDEKIFKLSSKEILIEQE
jgi:hypothetical protein